MIAAAKRLDAAKVHQEKVETVHAAQLDQLNSQIGKLMLVKIAKWRQAWYR
jgi:hypothetical protein